MYVCRNRTATEFLQRQVKILESELSCEAAVTA